MYTFSSFLCAVLVWALLTGRVHPHLSLPGMQWEDVRLALEVGLAWLSVALLAEHSRTEKTLY